jgi:hypothetical protein
MMIPFWRIKTCKQLVSLLAEEPPYIIAYVLSLYPKRRVDAYLKACGRTDVEFLKGLLTHEHVIKRGTPSEEVYKAVTRYLNTRALPPAPIVRKAIYEPTADEGEEKTAYNGIDWSAIFKNMVSKGETPHESEQQ